MSRIEFINKKLQKTKTNNDTRINNILDKYKKCHNVHNNINQKEQYKMEKAKLEH